MSIDAALGRIDQILSMQQQLLLGPAAAADLTSSDDGSLPVAGADGSGTSSFSDELASALSAGDASALSTGDPSALSTDDSGLSMDPLALSTLDPSSLSTLDASSLSALDPSALSTLDPSAAGGNEPPQVQEMTQMANSLVGKPYLYGGGHSGWGPSDGYDCSGFVSAVLHAGGYLSEPVDTVTLPDQPGIVSGPGQYVTIYDRSLPGESGHVIIEINGQFYESGGEAGSWGGGGGVEKINRPSASYLATFNDILHPSGL